MQPPAQELVARDLHDNTWTFRHIYRGNLLVILSSPFPISLLFIPTDICSAGAMLHGC